MQCHLSFSKQEKRKKKGKWVYCSHYFMEEKFKQGKEKHLTKIWEEINSLRWAWLVTVPSKPAEEANKKIVDDSNRSFVFVFPHRTSWTRCSWLAGGLLLPTCDSAIPGILSCCLQQAPRKTEWRWAFCWLVTDMSDSLWLHEV